MWFVTGGSVSLLTAVLKAESQLFSLCLYSNINPA